MKDDITPSLIESVNKSFEANYNSSPQIEKLISKEVKTYKDAYRYAEQVGQARALSYMEISSEVLPDGKMYYNIASRLMEDTLGADQQMIAEYAASAQETANKKSGINLKAQKADLNQDRIDGFVNRLSSEETFDDVAWILNEPVKTFARSVVDDTVKKNAEFQNRAGVKATVVRTSAPKCCEWCSNLAGTYTYPRVAGEVFARHDSCRCILDYEGRRLSAYEKNGKAHSFRDLGEQDRIDARKQKAQDEIKKIESTPFKTREAVGAMARKFYVESEKPLMGADDLYIKQGTYVEGVKVIASGEGIHDVKRLVSEYRLPNGELTKPEDWYKVRGRASITDGNSDFGKREVHWYQAKNIGKVEFKFPSNPKQR